MGSRDKYQSGGEGADVCVQGCIGGVPRWTPATSSWKQVVTAWEPYTLTAGQVFRSEDRGDTWKPM